MARKKGGNKRTQNKRNQSRRTRNTDPMSNSSLAKNAKRHGGVGVLL